jgi:hypothetical protein
VVVDLDHLVLTATLCTVRLLDTVIDIVVWIQRASLEWQRFIDIYVYRDNHQSTYLLNCTVHC